VIIKWQRDGTDCALFVLLYVTNPTQIAWIIRVKIEWKKRVLDTDDWHVSLSVISFKIGSLPRHFTPVLSRIAGLSVANGYHRFIRSPHLHSFYNWMYYTDNNAVGLVETVDILTILITLRWVQRWNKMALTKIGLSFGKESKRFLRMCENLVRYW